MLRRTLFKLVATPTRALATKRVPPENDIIRAFRRADYETAVTLFSRRPPSMRSNALHEAAILACAQVPDAVAAQAVLAAMVRPTHPAVASVVTALCRERDVSAAVAVLERVTETGLSVDHRLLTAVARALERSPAPHLAPRLRRLHDHAGRAEGPLSAAGFFVEEGHSLPEWQALRSRLPQPDVTRLVEAECRLHAARRNVRHVEAVWHSIQEDRVLASHVGVLSAAVNAFVASGRSSAAYSINTLMTWVRDHLYDSTSGKGKEQYTSNPSAMALLVTATTKAIAAAAPTDASLALSAYDILNAMQLPAFDASVPLTGAYFKVLQHANLPLSETRERIEGAWQQHVQLDEQAFSMALGAILRCDARVQDKLNEGRTWIAVMKSAGIPLTVRTYNLFAGQLRYCNDPQLVMSLLSDMRDSGVNPTAVTYGLIFSACVLQGDYSSTARKRAMPVALWSDVLYAMESHMTAADVVHTSYSLLSLARAYAHLGLTNRAFDEFDTYAETLARSIRDEGTLQSRLTNAYAQMIFNFAHCRECSLDGPDAAAQLFKRMQSAGLGPTRNILDSLLIASVRTGRAHDSIEFVKLFIDEGYDLRIGLSGLKHLLKAQMELQSPVHWEATHRLIVENQHLLPMPELKSTVEELVIRFARCGRRDICNEIMGKARVNVSGLDYVFEGREFSRFRTRSRQLDLSEDDSESSETLLTDNSQKENELEAKSPYSQAGQRSRSLHDEPAFPLG